MTILVLSLLVMILMRLVWMDIREYSPHFISPFSFDNLCSAGAIKKPDGPSHWSTSAMLPIYLKQSCEGERFKPDVFIRLNQGLLITSILAAVFLSRLFSRYWTLSLLIALMLLSRGRLLALNELISWQLFLMSIASFWLTLVYHWLRTASYKNLGFLIALSFFLPIFDTRMLVFPLALVFGFFTIALTRPLVLPRLVNRLRDRKNRGELASHIPTAKSTYSEQLRLWLGYSDRQRRIYLDQHRLFAGGSLLKALKIPFIMWTQHNRLWVQFSLIFFAKLLVCTLILMAQLPTVWPDFIGTVPLDIDGYFDIDVSISLFIITVGLMLGPDYDFPSLWEFLVILSYSLCFTYFADMAGPWLFPIDFVRQSSSFMRLLLEPALLSTAVFVSFQVLQKISRFLISR